MNYPDYTKIIHKEGYVFIVISSAVTFLLASVSSILGVIGLVITIFCIYFFRNPSRIIPISDNNIVAPADGFIQSITTVNPPEDLGMSDKEVAKISIVLNIYNVHVNRIPINGLVRKLTYHPGKFFNASLDKASIHNERQYILIETENQIKVGLVQIAGIISRRIICDLEENQKINIGDRFGIIRFGSRVDLYLPKNIIPIVGEKQLVIGGETIIAKLSANDSEYLEFKNK